MKWPWRINKELIENLQIENSKLKDSVTLIESKQVLASIEEKSPRSIVKDYKQDATQFIQECIENPLIKSLPAGCYYYTKSLIMHSHKLDFGKALFYTDKDIPFLYARGDNNEATGFGTVDVSDVKEPTGKAVFYIQHKSDHTGNGIFEFRINGSIKQIRETAGFNGIEFDGETKYPTDYKGGKYENGEAHRNIIRLYSTYLNKAVNMPKSGYSKAANIFYIIDHFSKMALNNEAGVRSEYHIEIEDRTILTELEREIPYIYIGTERNRIWLQGEVGGMQNIGGVNYYGHKYALVNNGSENVLYEDSHLVAEGKIIQNKSLILK